MELGIVLVWWQVQSGSQTVTVTMGPAVMKGSIVALVADIEVVVMAGMLLVAAVPAGTVM
jgi:hypothetical protein